MKIRLFAASILVMLVFFALPVAAQENQEDRPYYVVQEGDSLWDIAARFGVEISDLQLANDITDPGQLAISAELIIPGLDGYSGRLDTIIVPYGETLSSLSRRFRMPADKLARLNRLLNPSALYAGATLIAPFDAKDNPAGLRLSLAPGQSLMELAISKKQNPWAIILYNDLAITWEGLPGEMLYLPGEPGENAGGPGALPEAITAVSVNPELLSQGKTMTIEVSGLSGLVLSGSLAGHPLRFFENESGYIALQGIHAMTEPGLYQLSLKGTFPGNAGRSPHTFTYSQPVLVRSGDYAFDPALIVDPATLDPSVTQPEDELWADLGAPVTGEKMWTGHFQSPVPVEFANCWTSLFGSRRSYNGSAYNYFHSGLDFCGGIGTELTAPASGKVIFTGSLFVRGNVAVIDHGRGVYTAYDHLSEILVEPGDLVKPGQVIGLGGSTGRSTGPHLHWEVWVGGVQVDPTD